MSFRSSGVNLSLALGLGAAACTQPPEDVLEPTVETRHAIKDGYIDEHDTAVVGVYNTQFGGICSGSLLAPNVVLTARHCVSELLDEAKGGGIVCDETRFSGAHAADRFFVTTDTEMGEDASRYHTVREVVLPPTDDGLCGKDQAILILSASISPEAATPLVPRVDVPLVPGERYYAVGYGATSDANLGAGLRRRRDDLIVNCVADGCPSDDVAPMEWVGQTGICEGDSGGPSLDGEDRVIGVTSRGSVGCNSPVYGYVYGWGPWIKDTTLRAASLGGYEAPAWATGFPTDPAYTAEVGGACALAEECPANACLNSYCTRPCNDVAACPSGYVCEGAPGFCVRAPDRIESADEDDGSGISCSVRPRPDPTQPIPWRAGAAALSAFAVVRRWRRARARPA
jgi:Trypsin